MRTGRQHRGTSTVSAGRPHSTTLEGVETIDQLALVISLGVTGVAAVAALVWHLYRLLAKREASSTCVSAFFRTTLISALVSGSVGLAVLVWLVDALGLREYHHHYAYFVWFLAFLINAMLGAILAVGGAIIIERMTPPNPTPHTYAREVSASANDSGARAGERGR